MDTTKENLNDSKKRLSNTEYQWAVALVYGGFLSTTTRTLYEINVQLAIRSLTLKIAIICG
ncbi:hypothetical protein ID0445_09500 [Helicobacter pylori]